MSTKISNLEDQLKENTTLVLPVIESNMTKDDSEVEEVAEVFETRSNDNLNKSNRQNMYKCEKCEYKCKRKITMPKHQNTKHAEEHPKYCKQCNQTFTCSQKLLIHIAKEYQM